MDFFQEDVSDSRNAAHFNMILGKGEWVSSFSSRLFINAWMQGLSFDKPRMTFLSAMVSSHREPDERRTITLTLTLSPQGREKSKKGSSEAADGRL
jgi:hypothetical protein